MRKLMLFSFVVLFTVLAVLSCINYSYDGVDRIEQDKQRITIEKPETVTNTQFLNEINSALEAVNADIMYRYVDISGEKAQYIYFRTTNTNDFINTNNRYDNFPLGDNECISTTAPEGYTTYKFQVSSMFQDITFYSLEKAAVYDLSSCTYYVAADSYNEVTTIISDLGYTVTARSEAYISGKMSVVLFALIPICLMIMSMAFYVLSNGKTNVLRKMEGYRPLDILVDEIRSNGKTFLGCLLVIELVNLAFALFAFRDALSQYITFTAFYILIGLIAFGGGALITLIIIFTQKGSEQIKGKAPKKAMYYITMAVKCVFLVFIVFFMSIAIRNVQIAYNTYETSQFVAEKVNGYVTIPIFENNASYNGLEDNYLAFYKATEEKYDGILVDASNYEVDLLSGKTLCEEFGQEEITVNGNYLLLNPIYDMSGNAIISDDFVEGAINILIPELKLDRIDKYREFALVAYSKEVNFIVYDGVNSNVYSYNASSGSGSYGEIDQPIIIVMSADDLEGIFVLGYCSRGAYFIKPHTDEPYSELLPVLKETGIDAVTLQTPYILSNFDDVLSHQFQMLLLYGTQTIILSIGLACLILFSAKLYCENSRRKIAFCLVEGYSLISCIRQHLIIIIVSYLLTIIAVFFAEAAMQVSFNHYLIIGAFIIEIIGAFVICRKHTTAKLYEVLKGAE
ncbi:MAG: hypothetical protein LUG13_03230 [Oscillospiraceae bacterium]|nr:hypothetical protein [Oscillospiraceae bacterium]